MSSHPPRYLPAGECALVVEFGETIDPAIHDRVLALDAALATAKLEGVLEFAPTYRSLIIHFDPRLWRTEALIEAVAALNLTAVKRPKPKRWRTPVCYDPPHGEDLGEVSSLLGLTEERVIALHLGALYRVYMYGFAPGYTFLGGLPPELGISRRATPRPPAPPGALLIAGGQALIASIAMPTGWYALGRTPVKVFDPRRERPFLADVGDEIMFERIDAAAFEALRLEAEAGGLVARREDGEAEE